MPREGYLRDVRELVGSRPLLLPSVAGFVRDGERVVVGRHRDLGLWVIPGGGLEPGESPADAVVREAWEETGLLTNVVAVRGTYGGSPEHRVTYPNGDVCDYVVTVFDLEVVGGTLAGETVELTELRWVTEAELAALPTPAWIAPVLAHPRGWEPVTWHP